MSLARDTFFMNGSSVITVVHVVYARPIMGNPAPPHET